MGRVLDWAWGRVWTVANREAGRGKAEGLRNVLSSSGISDCRDPIAAC